MLKSIDLPPVKLLANPNWHWQADLELLLSKNNRGTRLMRNRHTGPLYVQKPFYPEGPDCAHIYLLHPPGGLVSGDTLSLDITIDESAHSVITTPGAGRMYKARVESPVQKQKNSLHVHDDSILEWFPMEAIVFNGAAAELETIIKLGDNSRFMGWEVTCFGLSASAEAFDTGYFKQRYRIEKNGLPLFIDNLRYEAKNTSLFLSNAGMQSKPVSGFFIAGPFELTEEEKESLSEQLRVAIHAMSSLASSDLSSQIAVTWSDSFCVVRYLGKSAYTCRQCFTLLWKQLRPALINREACEPRIWAT